MAHFATENIRTVALVGDGASGKTTLAEALLALRERLELVGGLWEQHVDMLALADLGERIHEARVAPGRHDVKGVAELAADCQLGHVRADEAKLALAVLAQRPDQRRGSRHARGREQNRERPHVRSIRSSTRR